jgi:hypothetical protein
MKTNEILIDAYSRIKQLVHTSATGLNREQLAYRPEPGANSIAWLIWHLTRIQDGHLATTTGLEEAWISEGWAAKFGMAADRSINGVGDGPEEVAAFQPENPDTLLGYFDAVYECTVSHLKSAPDSDFERIVDESYDPPVTAGVRLVSVLSDNIQHAGQARYLRGIVERLGVGD